MTRTSSRTNRTRTSRNRTDSGRSSDGMGNSALANRVRAATQRTNEVLASRGSRDRFDTSTGRQYQVRPEAVNEPITTEQIGAQPISLPQPTPIQDPGALAYSNNFGLSTPENPVNEQGLFVGSPQPTQPGSMNDYGAGLFNDYINAKGAIAPVNQEALYKQSLKDSGLEKARREVNNYSSRLNAITTKAQAESLGLEGQGRGITESIIGGQQAQINREAAIQALPIQGQLAAAQGNLELAQQHFSDLFKIRTADAQAQYDYKNKVVDAVYQFATQAQQQRLNELSMASQQSLSDKKSNISRQDSYVSIALQNGNAGLAGSIAALDPNDPTFGAKLASKIAQLSSGSGGDRLLTLDESAKYGVPFGMKLSDMAGSIPGEAVTGRQAAQTQTEIGDRINLIDSVASDSYLSSAVGPNQFARFDIRSGFTGGKTNFIANVERLTSAETLGRLLALKAAGGSLGALSEGERATLEKSATLIKGWEQKDKNGNVFAYKVKEDTFKKELSRLKQLSALSLIRAGANPNSISGVQVMPDGVYVIRNYDGTFTELK